MNTQAAASSRLMRGAHNGEPAQFAFAARRGTAWIRRWWRVRRNVEMLTALDDRLLADIGIARDQVRYVAHLGRLPSHD